MGSQFLTEYFNEYKRLAFSDEAGAQIECFRDIALDVRGRGGKLIFAGNGASASAAEHGAVDFTKQGQVRGITFHDPNLITCFANDFGYDHWVDQAIAHYADPEDTVVLLSVSGRSPSVVNAAKRAREMGLGIVTFTGRSRNNPLLQSADLAFHVDSDAYNIVECIHCIWLTATIDLVIGKSAYETYAGSTPR